MFKNVVYGFALLSGVFLSNGAALADNSPTLDQVYQAANAGRMGEAQSMMNKVLKDHPGSAKAHFVEAELLARQGQMGNAAEELKSAERLKPDLSFANTQAVQQLKSQIASAHPVNQSPSGSYQSVSNNSFPWGMLLLVAGVIAVIVLVMRAMNSRNTTASSSNYQPGMQNSSMPMQPYGSGIGPTGVAGGGIGSSIVGGLATGAAVGVGMVAGEALAHHFMDGGQSGTSNAAPVADTWGNNSNNLGGQDFGIADNSSWDDSSNVADSGSDVSGGDWG